MVKNKLPWHRDGWLSQILEQPVFRLSLPARLDERGQALLRRWLAGGEATFVSTKSRVGNESLAQGLRALGFVVMHEMVTLERRLDANLPLPEVAPLAIRWARADDEKGVAEIAAASFRCSRWHLDPAFSLAQADAVKAAWASNFFAGKRGDAMAVAADGRRVAGFVLLVLRESTLIYDLVAVDEAYRGRGLGTALVNWVPVSWKGKELTVLRVGTQSHNAAALALYRKVGFYEVGRQLIWHWHRQAASVRVKT